jgi:hypothetical protein
VLREFYRICKWHYAACADACRQITASTQVNRLDIRHIDQHNYPRNGPASRCQDRGVTRRRRAAPAPRGRARSPLRSASLFRPTGRRAGEVRDAASRRDRRRVHRDHRRGVRLSRPTFYQAQAAFAQAGLPGLLPQKRGPRGPHKLRADVLAFVLASRAAEGTSARVLAARIRERFGIAIHPRSLERAWRRQEKKHP